MRWREIAALFDKEIHELSASRAAALFVMALGPLVGHALVTAVDTYAEVSGTNGNAGALAQGISPLDGIVAPIFGAYAVSAMLLFPFVAIRLVSTEKENGALRLLLQGRQSLAAMVVVKFLTIVGAWIVAWLPGFLALAIWVGVGGHLDASETATVLLGHAFRGAFVAAVAIVAAAIADGAASAAVVTLAVTLGTWALDFVAQVHGGVAAKLARFTPEAALRTFERGEIRIDVMVVTLIVIISLIALSIVWLHPGRPVKKRVLLTVGISAAAIVLAPLGSHFHSSWDMSEDRRNSFSVADENALQGIGKSLHITVYLGPEDPRLADLDREVLHKLERTLPSVHIDYPVVEGTGMFERVGQHYGEVWYEIGDKRVMSRSTTPAIVLETIYELAGVANPSANEANGYTGYPVATKVPLWAKLFYGSWPLLVLFVWWALRRRPRISSNQPSLA